MKFFKLKVQFLHLFSKLKILKVIPSSFSSFFTPEKLKSSIIFTNFISNNYLTAYFLVFYLTIFEPDEKSIIDPIFDLIFVRWA